VRFIAIKTSPTDIAQLMLAHRIQNVTQNTAFMRNYRIFATIFNDRPVLARYSWAVYSGAMGTARFELPLEGRGDRLRAWADMLFSDHGLVRMAYLNMHPVAGGVWRSGQPSPGQLRAFARRGGRTVISLRAGRDFGSLPLELEACRDAGLAFHILPIRTHALPSREEFSDISQLFKNAERPLLMHCKSGADRSGFAAALYLMLAEGRPVAEARQQLAIWFGHNRHGRAGRFDAFFDAYERDTAEWPVPLMEWVEAVYDPVAISEAFQPIPMTARIGKILGR
jgi:protein tyrosine phosphatase (PTP) superfamily phosphohydrolase (DUF442 family)